MAEWCCLKSVIFIGQLFRYIKIVKLFVLYIVRIFGEFYKVILKTSKQ